MNISNPEADKYKDSLTTGMNNASAVTATADTRTVQDNELSRTHLNTMMSEDSPLMNLARNQGMKTSASRGLLNSSISSKAAQNSMIMNAKDFALQDARAYQQAAQDNMTARNNVNMQNAKMQTDVNIANAGEANRGLIAGVNLDAAALQSSLDRQSRADLQDDAQTFTSSENVLDRQSRADLQDDSQAFTADQSALDRQSRADLQDDAQAFTSSENELDRVAQRERQEYDTLSKVTLQDDQQAFESAEKALDRQIQSSGVNATIQSSMASTYFTAAGQISADPNLSAAAKKTQLDNLIAQFDGVMKTFDLIDPSTGTMKNNTSTIRN